MFTPETPIAIYMEGAVQDPSGKMGFGLLRYSKNPIVCLIDSKTAGMGSAEATGIPRDVPIVATVDEAAAMGAKAMVLGIAPAGGLIPLEWMEVIDHAIVCGLSIVNGLHDRLAPRYPRLPPGQWIWDIRVEPEGLSTGTGEAANLGNKRVLMVGTDMAVGKMTAGLELLRSLEQLGRSTSFVATGQIGITISGGGVPLDAVKVDYASSAVEQEVLKHAKSEVVVVEGQGAIAHPGSTSTLPLMRGSMPTHLVLCHRAGMKTLLKLESVPVAPLGDLIRLYEDVATACGAFPRPATVGVALNTSHLDDAAALQACQEVEQEVGLPCVDPVRHTMTRIAKRI